MRRLWKSKIVIIVTVIALLALSALVGALSRDGAVQTTSADSSGEVTRSSGAAGDTSVQGVDTGTGSVDKSAAQTTELAAAVPDASSPSTHYLVRTGDLSLLVARGTLSSSADHVRSLTITMGGYVMASALGGDGTSGVEPQATALDDTAVSGGVTQAPAETATSSSAATVADVAHYATLTVRVPERSFDTAVKRFSKLGSVQSLSTSSEDVTSEYVDLRARLRHYRAVERRLLSFLAQTNDVSQMLKVQDRIDDVQLTIEQLVAELKSMNEVTTYGTISILLREKGLPQAGSIDPTDTFWGTLAHSFRLVTRGARVTALALTAALPFLIVLVPLAVLVWYVTRRLRRAHRRVAEPTLPT